MKEEWYEDKLIQEELKILTEKTESEHELGVTYEEQKQQQKMVGERKKNGGGDKNEKQ